MNERSPVAVLGSLTSPFRPLFGKLSHFLLPAALILSFSLISSDSWARIESTLRLPEDLSTIKFSRINPESHQKRTMQSIIKNLNFSHYRKIEINDDLSERMLTEFIDALDPNRVNFFASDIKRFQSYQHTLDEAVLEGNLDPGYDIFNTHLERIIDRMIFSIHLIENEFDSINFNVEEYWINERKNLPWPETQAESDHLWRQQLKLAALSLRLADTTLTNQKLQSTLSKRYRTKLNLLLQTQNEEVFETITRVISNLYDPHTEYFSPRALDNFNINMSLSLEGIGAVLQNEDDYTKVVRLIPGGPADKSGQLHPLDKIIGVAQGKDGEIVDILGWRIEKVVDLIRGPKDSQITLEIIPAGSQTNKSKTVIITRNQVQLEDQAANSDVLELKREENNYRLGVIDIPTFYSDFQGQRSGNAEYRRASTDVAKLINKLKAKSIDGLILDLRSNGGGSLMEANQLLGLFIETGPTVQIRYANGRVELQKDLDPAVAYDGPLLVMVNRLSASASEILAGAVQDYQRGLVVGNRTFGKGTVQALRPLDRGQLKVTEAKFYRVSGASNQHQGIIPDIEMPDVIDPEDIGESALTNALPWDIIPPTRFPVLSSLQEKLPTLKTDHEKRIATDPDFIYLTERNKLAQEISKIDRISLNQITREKEIRSQKNLELKLENQRRVAKKLEPLKSYSEFEAQQSQIMADNRPDQVISEQDTVLMESGQILVDWIERQKTHVAAQN
ncbi:MAG: carboxy terminal-processing peptidase [Pseudomonadota bacterium]